jgi:hypothetical protein
MTAHKWTLKRFLYDTLYKKAWQNKEIKAEAEARSLETRQETAKTRAIEHEFKMVKERDKQRALLDEIDYYKHKDDEVEEPNQLAQLLPLIMMLKNAQSPEDLLPLLSGNQNPLPNQKLDAKSLNSTTTPLVQVSLSDEQIKAELAKLPKKYLQLAKNLSPEMARAYAHRHFDFDEPTIERAIEIIRGE